MFRPVYECYKLLFLLFVRYYSERGDAVAKASKQNHVVSIYFSLLSEWFKKHVFVLLWVICETHSWMSHVLCVSAYKLCVVCSLLQGDYRQLIHELDRYQYCELRLAVLEIRNTYVRHRLIYLSV